MPLSRLFGSMPIPALTDHEPLPTDEGSRPIKADDSFVNAAVAYVLVRLESKNSVKPKVDFGYILNDSKYAPQSSTDLPNYDYEYKSEYLTDGVCHQITPKVGIPMVFGDMVEVRFQTWKLDEAIEQLLITFYEREDSNRFWNTEDFSIEFENNVDAAGGDIVHMSIGNKLHQWWEIVSGVIDYEA